MTHTEWIIMVLASTTAIVTPSYSPLRTTDCHRVVQITHRNNICHLKKSRGRKNKIWLFTLKLASTIILIYVKLPKMAMFRCRKNYVPIKLETWNFEHSLEVAPTNDDRNIKFVRYRESGFLKTRFRALLSWEMYIYIDALARAVTPRRERSKRNRASGPL